MKGMERFDLPKWLPDGASDVQSPLFEDLAKTLDMTISALAAANLNFARASSILTKRLFL